MRACHLTMRNYYITVRAYRASKYLETEGDDARHDPYRTVERVEEQGYLKGKIRMLLLS